MYLVAAVGADVGATVLPLITDADADFARQYGATGASAFLVRPDGYLGCVQVGAVNAAGLVAALATTFA